MYLQFFKTACRIFVRERFYSLFNVMGLSIGLTVALIIMLYLQDDLTYDRVHKNAKNIYRVNSIYTSSGKENKFALSPVPFGPKIQEEYPEIRAFARIIHIKQLIYKYGKESFTIEGIIAADSSAFEIFTHQFILGDPATCFRSPNSIVLTEEIAKIIFKDKNPVGENLILNKTDVFQVTGVIRDLPDNVHLRYKALVPFKKFYPDQDINNSSFFNISVYTYVLFPDDYDPQQFYGKFPAFYDKYIAKRAEIVNQQYRAVIQPLLSIHFSKEWQYDLPNGNKTYIYAFLVIGLLVLSLACINFLNMTTARAERRHREIATKKILGSTRSELIFQFLGESVLMAILAIVVAFGILHLILEYTSFNQLIDKNLKVDLAHNTLFLNGALLLTIFTGALSGLYPAFYFSNTQPLSTLQNKKGSASSARIFRKVLVVFQMIISVAIIICTLAVDRQIEFIRTRDLGINKENLLILPLRDTLIANHFSTFKEKLIQNSNVLSVSSSHNLPAGSMANNIYRAETENGMEENNFFTLWASYDFIQTMGMTLLQGRDFDREIPTDHRSGFIINEKVAERMNWAEPLGKRLQQNFGDDGIPYYDGVVIGVVKDFNFASLHNAIEPMVLRLQDRAAHQALIKMNGKNIAQTMNFIKETWNSMSTEFPTDYKFLDEKFDELYKKDRQQNVLIRAFSWICILISCLGLLSLSSYITGKRTKEIVLRKLLGASVIRITFMLYREILILLFIASVIAIPLAYWLSSMLLHDFVYRAEFSIYVYLITLAGAIFLAVGTVSYHSLKASNSNPAQILQFE